MLKRILAMFLCLYAIASPAPCPAAWPVIDYSNLAQAISQVNKLSEQISKQVEMISQNAQMITQGGQMISLDQQMLAKFTSSYLGQILGVINNVDSLIQSSNGMTYQLSSLGSAFESSYRPNWSSMSGSTLVTQRANVQTLLMDTVKQSMTIQSRVTQDMATNKQQIQDLVTGSQNAQGQTEAIQAGNQLLAQIASELLEIQGLLASQAKAVEAATSYQVAEADRARELARKDLDVHPVTYPTVTSPW